LVLQFQQKEDQMNNYDPSAGPGRPIHDPTDPNRAPDNGRPGYVLLAALAGVVLVGGFLYFGNPMNEEIGPEQAQVPAPIERTVTDTPAATPETDRPAAVPVAPQE
jgi:hypothetical protein